MKYNIINSINYINTEIAKRMENIRKTVNNYIDKKLKN